MPNVLLVLSACTTHATMRTTLLRAVPLEQSAPLQPTPSLPAMLAHVALLARLATLRTLPAQAACLELRQSPPRKSVAQLHHSCARRESQPALSPDRQVSVPSSTPRIASRTSHILSEDTSASIPAPIYSRAVVVHLSVQDTTAHG